jgi:hypothetical protein
VTLLTIVSSGAPGASGASENAEVLEALENLKVLDTLATLATIHDITEFRKKKDRPVPIQIPENFAAVPIHADWWDADEFVYIKPTKGYISDTRARTNASRIPDGMTWEDLQKLSAAQRSKMELFDGGDYQLTIFEDCIISWTLRFPNNPNGSPGKVIPCTKQYMAVLPDKDGTFIADEITKRGGGIAAQVTAESKADFPEPADDAHDGEVSGEDSPIGEEATDILRSSRENALVS